MLEEILKYILRFLGEYGELETVVPGDRAEASLGESGEASGAGVSRK